MTPRRMGLCAVVLLITVVLSVLGVVALHADGDRIFTMETPSMCPTVCVGSLVVDQPVSGPIHRGELISFRPPGHSQVFTHRVYAVSANGAIRTKGDAEASPDPWILTRSQLVGQVRFTLWGLGWWDRALPFLAVGVAALVLLRKVIRASIRRAFERLCCALIVIVPLWILHPLIRGTTIQTTSDPARHSWIKSLVVNTGLLPAQFHVGQAQVLSYLGPSQLHFISGPRDPHGILAVRQWASLPWWGWALLALAVLSPLLGYVLWDMRRAVTPIDPSDHYEADPVQEQSMSLAETVTSPPWSRPGAEVKMKLRRVHGAARPPYDTGGTA